MVNAIISDKIMGINNEGIPYVQFQFIVKGELNEEINSNLTTVRMTPIFLLKEGDTLSNSGMAESFVMILQCIGVTEWEAVLGKTVQIEFDDKNNVTKMANILDEENYIVFSINKPETVTEPEVVEE